jgi:hypothetical protein
MTQPQQTAPRDPEPGDRRAQVADRTKHLRTMGVAGAVATLGVFAGLAAVTHAGSSAAPPAATGTDSSPGAASGGQPDDQPDRFDQFGGFDDQFDQGDFFDQGGSSGISPGTTGSPPGTMSGGS